MKIKITAVGLLALSVTAMPSLAQDTNVPRAEEQRAVESRPTSESRAPASKQKPRGQPVYLQDLRQDNSQNRQPSTRTPAAESPGRLETTDGPQPTGTQLAFFELTPTLGALSIEDKMAFTIGTNFSFRLAENTPLYFEPTFLVSFLAGDNDQNTSIFHLDGGLRLDWVISGSPLVPFVKAAVGPSLSTNSNTTVNGETISDSYFNLFAGGGVKVLVNPKIAARFDTGVTMQRTDPGLYALGAIALPL